MKLFIKKNILFIIMMGILFIWGGKCMYDEYITKKKGVAYNDVVIERCETGFYGDVEGVEEHCRIAYEFREKNIFPDAIWFFFYVLYNTSIQRIDLLSPLFVMIPAIYWFFREYKSGYFKNKIMREGYATYFKKTYRSSLKYILVIPVFLLFMFICALFASHFRIDLSYYQNWANSSMPMVFRYFEQSLWFLVIYLSTFILHSIFWINLAYIGARKSKNFYQAIIKSFLIYLGLWISLEILVGMFIFSKGLGAEETANYLNLTNIWYYEYMDDMVWYMPIYGIALSIISYFFVYFLYKDQEEVLIDVEK